MSRALRQAYAALQAKYPPSAAVKVGPEFCHDIGALLARERRRRDPGHVGRWLYRLPENVREAFAEAWRRMRRAEAP
jgi:hypothetical protein